MVDQHALASPGTFLVFIRINDLLLEVKYSKVHHFSDDLNLKNVSN